MFMFKQAPSDAHKHAIPHTHTHTHTHAIPLTCACAQGPTDRPTHASARLHTYAQVRIQTHYSDGYVGWNV